MTDQSPVRSGQLQWVGVGAGVVALVLSLLSWTSVSIPRTAENIAYDGGNSAWSSGFSAWAAVLLLVLAGAVAFLQTPRPRATLAYTWLGLAALSVLLILFRWFTADSVIADNLNVSGDKLDQLEKIAGASSGAAIGLFVTLLAGLVSAAAAWLSLRQART